MLLLYWIFEIVKHPVYWILYIPAYFNRNWVRKNKERNIIAFILWTALDDSVMHDKETYDYENHRIKQEWFDYGIPKWLKHAPAWIKAWWWGAWRNNSVNLLHYIRLKEFKGIVFKIGNECNFYEIKKFSTFPYYFPYFEFRIKNIMFSSGWLRSGVMQTLVRYRPCISKKSHS